MSLTPCESRVCLCVRWGREVSPCAGHCPWSLVMVPNAPHTRCNYGNQVQAGYSPSVESLHFRAFFKSKHLIFRQTIRNLFKQKFVCYIHFLRKMALVLYKSVL